MKNHFHIMSSGGINMIICSGKFNQCILFDCHCISESTVQGNLVINIQRSYNANITEIPGHGAT